MNGQNGIDPSVGGEEKKQAWRELIPLQLTPVCVGIAVILILTLVVQVLVVAMAEGLMPDLLKKDWFSVMAASVPMYLVAMPLSYFVFRLGRPFAPKSRQSLSLWAILGLIALSFGVAMLGSRIGDGVQAVISSLMGKSAVNPVTQATTSTPFWANLLFLGILAPIAEEIVYRKLVIDRLRPLGDLAAVILSGLFFGLIHGNFSQFFYAAMFGIVAGVVYTQTGKLRYTVVMHLAVNLIGGVFSAELIRALSKGSGLFGQSLSQILYDGYAIVMILCVALTPILLFLWRKRIASLWSAADQAPVGMIVRQPAVWLLAALAILLVWL